MQSTAGRRSANGDWFEKVFGFPEHRFSYDDIRKHMFKITKNAENETILTATGGNGITFRAGQISRPSLGELRHRNAEFMAQYSGPQQDTMNATTTSPAGHHECRTPCLSFSVISGDVQTYHGDPKNKFCTIQVASQLNCLEYVMPGLTPEQGITGYAMDRTQGPACCVCTAPGIAVRNYFLEEYVGAGGGPVVSELQKERDEAEEDGGVATAQAEAQPLPEEGPTEVSSRRPDEANNFEEVAEYLGIPNKSNEGDPEQVGFSVFSDPEARFVVAGRVGSIWSWVGVCILERIEADCCMLSSTSSNSCDHHVRQQIEITRRVLILVASQIMPPEQEECRHHRTKPPTRRLHPRQLRGFTCHFVRGQGLRQGQVLAPHRRTCGHASDLG